MTIFGAVANFTSEIQTMLHKSTNQDGFRDFLLQLKAYQDEHYLEGPFYLVLDNHKAHYGKKVRETLRDFKVLFLPPYSGYMSGVERLWSLLKLELEKHIGRMSQELSQEAFEAEVDWLCTHLNEKYDGKRLFMGARTELLKALE